MTLKTLEENDQEVADRKAAWIKETRDVPNGIACPNCGKELVDTDLTQGLSVGMYDYTGIHCTACPYKGKRRRG